MAVKRLSIREHLIAAGVKNLHEFGYPTCTAENILTDCVYREFFRSMLESNLGKNAAADVEIKKLLKDAANGR